MYVRDKLLLTSPEKSLRINSLKAMAISAEHKLEHLNLKVH
jgi:hypothetical protein